MLLIVSTSSDMIFGDTCTPQNGHGYNSNVVILSFESCMWDLLVLGISCGKWQLLGLSRDKGTWGYSGSACCDF